MHRNLQSLPSAPAAALSLGGARLGRLTLGGRTSSGWCAVILANLRPCPYMVNCVAWILYLLWTTETSGVERSIPACAGKPSTARTATTETTVYPRVQRSYRMTVIFHTNAGAPVLAGDMLVSVPGPNAYTDLRLPSHPNGIAVPSDVIPGYLPILMRRKVFIVNERLAVGVAGMATHARSFIRDLTRDFRDRNAFTRSELTGFLDQYGSSEDGREALEQIGVLVLARATDWNGSLTKGLFNQRKEVTRRFGTAIAIGTGSDSVIEEIQRLDNDTKWGSAQPPDEARRFPEFDTLAHNLILLGRLYWKEFTSQANVFDAWVAHTTSSTRTQAGTSSISTSTPSCFGCSTWTSWKRAFNCPTWSSMSEGLRSR